MKLALRTDAVDLATDFEQAAFVLDRLVGYSVQYIWENGVGLNTELVLEGSNNAFRDPNNELVNPDADWDLVPGSNYVITSASGTKIIEYDTAYYRYLRVRNANTAGTGDMEILYVGKDRGN